MQYPLPLTTYIDTPHTHTHTHKVIVAITFIVYSYFHYYVYKTSYRETVPEP